MITPPPMQPSEERQHEALTKLRDELFWKAILPEGSSKFKQRFSFKPSEQSQTTEEVVRLISSILSPYLTESPHLECSKLATRDIHVCGATDFREAAITKSQIAAFHTSLRGLITDHLGQQTTRFLVGDGPVRYLELKARYTPLGKLWETATIAGIEPTRYLFPKNTSIRIAPQRNTLSGPVDEILVAVDLTAPLPLKKGELVSLLSKGVPLKCKRSLCFEEKRRDEDKTQDKEVLVAALKTVSKEVSDLLGFFITQNGCEQWRISDAEKTAFQESVIRQITDGINMRIATERHPVVWFSTNSRPEGFLKTALGNAGIAPEKSCKLFPPHSGVTVHLLDATHDRIGEFEISLNFPGTKETK